MRIDKRQKLYVDIHLRSSIYLSTLVDREDWRGDPIYVYISVSLSIYLPICLSTLVVWLVEKVGVVPVV